MGSLTRGHPVLFLTIHGYATGVNLGAGGTMYPNPMGLTLFLPIYIKVDLFVSQMCHNMFFAIVLFLLATKFTWYSALYMKYYISFDL